MLSFGVEIKETLDVSSSVRDGGLRKSSLSFYTCIFDNKDVSHGHPWHIIQRHTHITNNTHTDAHTDAHTHAQTHTRTHTHTHTRYTHTHNWLWNIDMLVYMETATHTHTHTHTHIIHTHNLRWNIEILEILASSSLFVMKGVVTSNDDFVCVRNHHSFHLKSIHTHKQHLQKAFYPLYIWVCCATNASRSVGDERRCELPMMFVVSSVGEERCRTSNDVCDATYSDT